MNWSQMLVFFGMLICLMMTLSQTMVSAAPSYPDYENLRNLYELLLEKEGLADSYQQSQHRVRKNSRSPSLRLRFGRRSDPSFYQRIPNDGPDEHEYQNLQGVPTTD